jgi:hypothetical protein
VSADDERPVLRVVSGNPSPEELAALTAVVAASSGSAARAAAPQRGRWNDPAAQHRRMWLSGPGAWRAAGR